MPRKVDDLLAEARADIERLEPAQAQQLLQLGALLIDIRPEHQRRTHGVVPGALIIERNVFEWRLDPTSEFRVPQADGHDRCVLVLCQEGYASSLAAASLRALGYTRTGDVIGGFDAWQAAGLPVAWPGACSA
jgi:rhodanese-related sulfurtransferase